MQNVAYVRALGFAEFDRQGNGSYGGGRAMESCCGLLGTAFSSLIPVRYDDHMDVGKKPYIFALDSRIWTVRNDKCMIALTGYTEELRHEYTV